MKNRAKSVGELLEEWPQPCSRSDRQALCFRAVKRLARPIEMPGFFHLCSALNTGRACIITGLGWRWKTVMNPGQVASRIGCLPSASTTPCRSRARLDRSVWCGMSQRCLWDGGKFWRSQNHAIAPAQACHLWLRLGKGRRMIAHAPAPSLLPPGDHRWSPGGRAFSSRAFLSTDY